MLYDGAAVRVTAGPEKLGSEWEMDSGGSSSGPESC